MSSSISYNKWKSMVLKHLENYKINVLDVQDCGSYSDEKKAHILPKGVENKNYLFDFSDASRICFDQNSKHHMAHHLNSSQTMCLNFFYGLEKYEYLNCFINRYIISGSEKEAFKPEYVEEKRREKTHFDFWIKTTDDKEIFFEIKYTENGFSKKTASVTDNWKSVYEPLCTDSLYLKDIDNDTFLNKKFQLYRNIVRARANSYVVFLTMQGNTATYKDLIEYENNKDYEHIKILYWERIIADILADKDINEELKAYMNMFKVKYLDIGIDQ